MEIEYKNSVKDISKGIYKVGNVISRFGSPFLVARDDAGFYCLVDLSNGRIFTPDCATLKILAYVCLNGIHSQQRKSGSLK